MLQIEKPDGSDPVFLRIRDKRLQWWKWPERVRRQIISVLIYQALYLAKSLSFTDKSMKMAALSVIGLLQNGGYGQNGQNQPFVRKFPV